jgi:hypothetical protein
MSSVTRNIQPHGQKFFSHNTVPNLSDHIRKLPASNKLSVLLFQVTIILYPTLIDLFHSAISDWPFVLHRTVNLQEIHRELTQEHGLEFRT